MGSRTIVADIDRRETLAHNLAVETN